MARLVSAAIEVARVTLQDVAGDRYTDPQMIGFINDAIVEARTLRPDLFVYEYGTATPQVTVVGDTIPLPDQFFTALCYYIAGRAEMRDDEFALDGRAMTFTKALASKLIQGL